MGKKLYVGNLSYDVSSADLGGLLGQHGKVHSAQVIEDRDTGRSKGFGFVEMGSEEETQAAITALDGNEFQGRNLKVNEARPRPERRSGSDHDGDGAVDENFGKIDDSVERQKLLEQPSASDPIIASDIAWQP